MGWRLDGEDARKDIEKRRMKKPVIGITLDKEGDYLRLKYHYVPAVVGAGGTPVLIPYGNEPSLIAEMIDGLLIPGGGDIDPSYYNEGLRHCKGLVSRERTEFEIGLLKAVMKLKKPVFGICYGMQLINVAFGGSLYQDIKAEFGEGGMTIDHSKGEHRISGHGRFIDGEFLVGSSHHQAVRKIGEGLEATAISEEGLTEAIELRDYPFLLGVQWHPERSADELSRSLFASFLGST